MRQLLIGVSRSNEFNALCKRMLKVQDACFEAFKYKQASKFHRETYVRLQKEESRIREAINRLLFTKKP